MPNKIDISDDVVTLLAYNLKQIRDIKDTYDLYLSSQPKTYAVEVRLRNDIKEIIKKY